ncbi:MAG: diaminopimelate epimerase [Actinomycetes bacterium]
MSGVRFVKGHGTENDFVLLPDPERALDLTPRLAAAICDRRAGVGGDGVLRLVLATADPEGAPMSDRARWFMDYRNADGSVAEMCGNGVRVVARYLVDAGLEQPGAFGVATRDGVKAVRLGETGDVTVDMGVASFPGPAGVKVSVPGRSWPATSVDMGNPHAVCFVDDLDEAGDLIEVPHVDPAFTGGVNVEFVVARGDRHVAMRVHERGVGETRSCGTGACAVMVAAARRDGIAPPSSYVVDVPGGSLVVTERADGRVELTGPAVLVAEGELQPQWLAVRR